MQRGILISSLSVHSELNPLEIVSVKGVAATGKRHWNFSKWGFSLDRVIPNLHIVVQKPFHSKEALSSLQHDDLKKVFLFKKELVQNSPFSDMRKRRRNLLTLFQREHQF